MSTTPKASLDLTLSRVVCPQGKKDKGDKPKRAPSGFIFFCNANRAEVLKKSPGLPVPEVSIGSTPDSTRGSRNYHAQSWVCGGAS